MTVDPEASGSYQTCLLRDLKIVSDALDQIIPEMQFLLNQDRLHPDLLKVLSLSNRLASGISDFIYTTRYI